MGVKISIDKKVSELEDILEMSPHYLSRVNFDSNISPDITQHLKVLKLFYDLLNLCYLMPYLRLGYLKLLNLNFLPILDMAIL